MADLSPEERQEAAEANGFDSWDAWVEDLEERYGGPICGEPTASGCPCAYNLDGEHPCYMHDTSRLSQRDTERDRDKARFIEEYRDRLVINEAAVAIGREASTIYRWRQQDPEFDRKVREARDETHENRVQRVEDAVFRQIVDGSASGALTIFWLCNQAPESYKDVKKIVTEDETDVVGQLREAWEKLRENGQLPESIAERGGLELESAVEVEGGPAEDG